MVTLLWIIYILDCLLLIGIILLQPGEGSDLAAAFGGAASQTAFGARGSATFMQKLTSALAILFMLLSVVLVIVTNMRQKNIMERNLPAVEQKKPAEETPKPGTTPAPPAAPSNVPAQAQTPGGGQTAATTAPAPVQPAPEATPAPAGKEAPKPPTEEKR
jgi:preprotein translocase subunit SecG